VIILDSIQVQNHRRNKACPLCHATQFNELGQLDYQGKARFSTCEVELSHVAELWRCRVCGSGFVQNALDEVTARHLYTAGEAGDRWSTQPFTRNKTRLVIQTLKSLFRPGYRLLDVGANTGELLDFAKQSGCVTAGLEYSQSSRTVLIAKGHGALASFDDVDVGYDIITAFDLVEHLYDVPSFLHACHDKLAPAGKLVLLTGDIQSPSAQLAANHWWYLQYPEHIVFPSRSYLGGLTSFRLQALYRTYASVGYQRPKLLGVAQLLRRRLLGGRYNGLPALGPDHMLVVLERRGNEQ